MTSQIISVNVGGIAAVEHNGRTVQTGIYKEPTTEPQMVTGIHIGTDEQADMDGHGGPHKAVYAYATEDYDWWSQELDRKLQPALFGENLTTSGLDVSGAKVGDRWRIGDALLEVSEPRVPCFKLGIAVGIPRFQKRFADEGRPGAYLRIVEDGHVTVGDVIEVEPTPDASLTMSAINATYHREPHNAGLLLDVPRLSDPWKAWARRQLN